MFKRNASMFAALIFAVPAAAAPSPDGVVLRHRLDRASSVINDLMLPGDISEGSVQGSESYKIAWNNFRNLWNNWNNFRNNWNNFSNAWNNFKNNWNNWNNVSAPRSQTVTKPYVPQTKRCPNGDVTGKNVVGEWIPCPLPPKPQKYKEKQRSQEERGDSAPARRGN